MSYSCAEWRGEIGAYIVGALDAPARTRVRRHLAACAGCRAEYDDLVPVRAWLGQLARAGGRPDTGRAEQPGNPPHASLPADPYPDPRLDAVPVPHSRRESGTWSPAPPPGRLPAIRLRAILLGPRRSLLAAAAAGLAALVISGSSARSFRAVDSATGVSGRAQLHDTPTGTQIDLTARGLPGGQRCLLVAVARGGADIAGTWDATYDGSARIAGTSGFPASQLTTLRIETDTGVVLLSIRVWP